MHRTANTGRATPYPRHRPRVHRTQGTSSTPPSDQDGALIFHHGAQPPCASPAAGNDHVGAVRHGHHDHDVRHERTVHHAPEHHEPVRPPRPQRHHRSHEPTPEVPPGTHPASRRSNGRTGPQKSGYHAPCRDLHRTRSGLRTSTREPNHDDARRPSTARPSRRNDRQEDHSNSAELDTINAHEQKHGVLALNWWLLRGR